MARRSRVRGREGVPPFSQFRSKINELSARKRPPSGQEPTALMQADSATTAHARSATGPVAAIAARYADALFELARDADSLERVEADLGAMRAGMTRSPDFRAFLRSPAYGAAEKEAAISAIAARAGAAALTANFLALVARNRRLFALDAMIEAFAARLADHRGEVRAEALAAAPLNEDHARRLLHEIEAMVGKAVNLDIRVDPDLLGGLVVKIGSTMIDSSLKTKLSRLKSRMKEA